MDDYTGEFVKKIPRNWLKAYAANLEEVEPFQSISWEIGAIENLQISLLTLIDLFGPEPPHWSVGQFAIQRHAAYMGVIMPWDQFGVSPKSICFN